MRRNLTVGMFLLLMNAMTAAQTAPDAQNARLNSLQSTLQTLRSQIELYKIQHNDMAPTLAGMLNWAILTGKTDAVGQMKPDGTFGPYMTQIPVNPITGRTA